MDSIYSYISFYNQDSRLTNDKIREAVKNRTGCT